MRKIVKGLVAAGREQCPRCHAWFDPANGHWCK